MGIFIFLICTFGNKSTKIVGRAVLAKKSLHFTKNFVIFLTFHFRTFFNAARCIAEEEVKFFSALRLMQDIWILDV